MADLPKIKELKVGITFTKNLNNFQNVKITEEIIVEVENDAQFMDVRNATYELIKDNIRNELLKFKPKPKSK